MITLPFRNSASLDWGDDWVTDTATNSGTVSVTTNPAGGARAVACCRTLATKSSTARRIYFLSVQGQNQLATSRFTDRPSIVVHLVGACFSDGGNVWNNNDGTIVCRTNNGANTVGSAVALYIYRSGGSYYYRLSRNVSSVATFTLANRALRHEERHDVRILFVHPPTGLIDGSYVLQTRYADDEDWVTEISQVINGSDSTNRTAIGNLIVGFLNASGMATTTVTPTYSTEADRWTVDQTDIAIMDGETDPHWRTSHALDVSDTQCTVRMNIVDGEWASATHARIVYAAGESASGGTPTTARAISSFDDFDNYVETISGLSANTRYSAVIQVATDSGFGTIVATSHTFRFKTVPSKGSPDDVRRVRSSCVDQHFSAIMTRHTSMSLLLAEMASEPFHPHRIQWLGDLGYSDAGPYWGRTSPAYETAAQFHRMHEQVFCFDELAELAAHGAFMSYPDDHDVSTDDGDGRMRTGGSLANEIANDWDGLNNYLAGEYGALTTLGDITEAGLEAYESWWGPGWIGREVSTEYYGSRTAGREYEIIYDTRWLRNPAATAGDRMTGATQKAWIAAEIAAAAADTDITDIRLTTGGPLWEIGDRSDDNAFSIDPDFTEWLIQELLDNIRSDQRVILACGDAHMHAVFHRHLPNGTGAGQLDDERFIEKIVAGVATNTHMPLSGTNSVFNATAVANDTLLWHIDPSQEGIPAQTVSGEQRWGRSSPILERRNFVAGTEDHWFSSANGIAAGSVDWGGAALLTGLPAYSFPAPPLLRRRYPLMQWLRRETRPAFAAQQLARLRKLLLQGLYVGGGK